ncbi:efflux RND transporter periplasmic adaptor subunit [Gluconacetobacter azotocaptans]|uniref:Efflux RND transporter periplasmic adaptor subunit n=1 Tax=Gluconacetobacter azotocaptans TaxID=142834 RepID=A0A7W4JUL6_9PROT|nr:efflux RND transporter periplasmic adaptor subunit [Gluconacetobacter azotocaptans]MBB2191120.1 efflux RND transporter periplasmic adaptor subunit [Gluconacetobacter azotocaptans]GBQ33139.1 membrane-fusion protein [Gluconacetobacter azotocaptans DSM 13594]
MPDPDPSPPAGRKPRPGRIVIAGAVVFGIILVAGTLARIHSRHQLHAENVAAAVPTVTVVHPGGNAIDTLVLPGVLQAWYSAPVYARTSGYLRRWYVDIGQKVQEGQVLAEIDTPDVDLQLAAARAALGTRTAQRDLAGITSRRWNRLNAQNAVSQQETDERRGNFAASEATRHEAAAEVERLETLSGFKRIVAPFSGVVTSRATDIGALIIAGTSTTQPLFTVSDVTRLRLYVRVPQAYAARMRDGLRVHFTVPDYQGRTFEARLFRSADAVDSPSGSMLVQLVHDNADGLLKPGAYAQIAFTFDGQGAAASPTVRIPASSLLFRKDGTTVALVDGNGHVRIKPISIVTDFGTELEVTGLTPQSVVIDTPMDDIRDGDEVNPQENKHAS